MALIGAFVGGYLAWPKCSTEFGLGGATEKCHNVFGPISTGGFPEGVPPFPLEAVLGMVILGAVVGGLVGLAIGKKWPHTKKNLGIPDD